MSSKRNYNDREEEEVVVISSINNSEEASEIKRNKNAEIVKLQDNYYQSDQQALVTASSNALIQANHVSDC